MVEHALQATALHLSIDSFIMCTTTPFLKVTVDWAYCAFLNCKTSSVAAGFGRHGMPPPASNPNL